MAPGGPRWRRCSSSMASFSRCSASRSRRSAASSAVEAASGGGGGCCGELEVRIFVQDREVSASRLAAFFQVFVLRAQWKFFNSNNNFDLNIFKKKSVIDSEMKLGRRLIGSGLHSCTADWDGGWQSVSLSMARSEYRMCIRIRILV